MKRRKRKTNIKKLSFITLILFIIVAGGIFAYMKYAPTKERMSLSTYFTLSREDEAAVIINGTYDKGGAEGRVNAIHYGDDNFLNLGFVKENLDNGYVYDDVEGILRYATDTQVVTVKNGDINYTQGRDTKDFGRDIILNDEAGVFLNAEFISMFTDMNYHVNEAPLRITIETAGTGKRVATITGPTEVRREGGPKSLILKDAAEGDSVWILDNYGKWSKVLTQDGVIGCVRNSYLSEITDTSVEANLPSREYKHTLVDKPVIMGWHQVMGFGNNSSVDSVLNSSKGINVISPTWYRLSSNSGGISDIASAEYVNKCHARGVEVWGMVSNVDDNGVDSNLVLNRTSARDNLVNTVVASAIANNLDGINVDFEALSVDAADGYVQFIKELGLKCKSNDLVLSVDNYPPESYNLFYNRKVQADYADYVVIMAYDEHHGASETAGSNSSLPYVKKSIEETMKEVPAEQIVLGLPFYTRAFMESGGLITNETVAMNAVDNYLSRYGATKTWLPEEEQNYASFENNGKAYKIWVEDEQSMTRKLAQYKEYGVAGVSFWRLGLEPASIWNTVTTYVN